VNASPDSSPRSQVVIVGAGFGGLFAAQALADTPVDVTVIDRHNYHLFQPLLYQVATAGLSPADIAWPVRSILRRQANATVLLGEVTGVDTQTRDVLVGGRRVRYDWLVLATGARHAYFGHDDWEGVAPGLKRIEDATDIRARVLLAFERAEAEPDPAKRRGLLSFIVVGGGPTGVELAGALAELARRALARDFRRIDPRGARIVLLEAGPRILPTFPETLSAVAQRSLEKLGVEVRTGKAVTACDETGVNVGENRIAARTILWAAGVAASPAAAWIGAEADRAGRIKVNPDLSVPWHQRIFAVGDTALAVQDGKPVPGVAPAAKQQGHYVANVIAAAVRGQPAPPPFRYRDYGNLATIGRKFAVIDFGWIRLSGFIAWVLWCVAHVYYLIGVRNRLIVSINWLWAYFTFQRGARLITASRKN
jgi:NADH:ubiquinone reductase (H+-translocating)